MNKKINFPSKLAVGSLLTCLSISFLGALSAYAEETKPTVLPIKVGSSVEAAPAAAAPAPVVVAQPAATSTLPLGSVKAPKVGDFTPTLGLKVLSNSARTNEYQDLKGRRAYGKSEYFIGVNHSSGFGVQAMAVTRAKVFSTEANNTAYTPGNPSVSLLHPILKNDDWKVTGTLRKYFNVTDSAKKSDYNHVAYYLSATRTLGFGWAVSNVLNPRTFLQDSYSAGDTIIHVNDTLTATKSIASWVKLGAGADFSFERHHATANGTYLQAFPTAIFTPSENIFIQASVYFPLQTVNVVDDAADKVSLNNTQAQLFMQMSM